MTFYDGIFYSRRLKLQTVFSLRGGTCYVMYCYLINNPRPQLFNVRAPRGQRVTLRFDLVLSYEVLANFTHLACNFLEQRITIFTETQHFLPRKPKVLLPPQLRRQIRFLQLSLGEGRARHDFRQE